MPIKTKTFAEFAYQDLVAQQSGLVISKRNTSNAHGLIYSHRGNEKNAESVLLTWARADYERKGGGTFLMICAKLVTWAPGSGIPFDISYVGGSPVQSTLTVIRYTKELERYEREGNSITTLLIKFFPTRLFMGVPFFIGMCTKVYLKL